MLLSLTSNLDQPRQRLIPGQRWIVAQHLRELFAQVPWKFQPLRVGADLFAGAVQAFLVAPDSGGTTVGLSEGFFVWDQFLDAMLGELEVQPLDELVAGEGVQFYTVAAV